MINRVDLSKAKKDILKVPMHIRTKLFGWVEDVEERGLDEVKKVPGYHDEPLRGKRAGQRSIRLSRSYRAIYIKKNDGMEFVSIEEVHKHEY
jgi:proteic killer suppression protein